jgi:ABC-type nickel/cobalt efflux system permease component RcnA
MDKQKGKGNMRNPGLILFPLSLFLFPCAAAAHPVPREAHDRTLVVKPDERALTVEYRLEVDEFTAVYVDARTLLDPDATVDKRNFHTFYLRSMADYIAGGLKARLDGRPLTFRCVRQEFQVLDHLRCDFVFQADWRPVPDVRHSCTVRDTNFKDDREPGRAQLRLEPGPALLVLTRVEPDAALQAKPPIERAPGDEERLRSARVEFLALNPVTQAALGLTQTAGVMLHAAAPPGITLTGSPPPTAAAPAEPPARPAEPGGRLYTLLDSPQGVGLVLLMAALFGAAHALTPGHGKTLVAAYLVGERGTIGHAFLLGLVTTLTHTGAVIVIAALLPVLVPQASAASIQSVLGFVGGLLVTFMGVWLLLRRVSGQADHVHIGGGHHHHHHHHEHPPTPGGEAPSWRSLVLLGVTGGIVPCWDAVLLLGMAVATQRLKLALPLLLAFSAGLAGVLVAIGVAVVSAKGLVSARWHDSRLVKSLPIISAVLVTVMGLWLCRDSLQPPHP